MRTEITKSCLNRICQHCCVKTGTLTPSFYYVFNMSFSCNINIPRFIGNLWWDLLLGNHLKRLSRDSCDQPSMKRKFCKFLLEKMKKNDTSIFYKRSNTLNFPNSSQHFFHSLFTNFAFCLIFNQQEPFHFRPVIRYSITSLIL